MSAAWALLAFPSGARAEQGAMVERTAEALYVHLKLDRMFQQLEERIIPKELVKYKVVATVVKTIIDGKIVYTWTY